MIFGLFIDMLDAVRTNNFRSRIPCEGSGEINESQDYPERLERKQGNLRRTQRNKETNYYGKREKES